jgi:sulfide:quinone oxidoreductase
MSEFRVVICGGGIAAVEGLLRLRKLVGDSVEIELIAPNEDLVYRPMAVGEPFAFGPAERYPLRHIARDGDAQWTQDTLSWVDPSAQVVHTGEGRRVEYDALLVAIGARMVETYKHVATFRDAEADAIFRGIVQDVEGGYTRRLTFIQPVGPVWPLPLYELALMTAERAHSMDIRDLELNLVTPEVRPLAVFGAAVSDVVTARLADAGVRVFTNSLAKVSEKRQVRIEPQGVELKDQRIVAMPRVAGNAIRGLSGSGADGFLAIDKHCCVPGTEGHVYAAGDAAKYPIKHGGIGSQMADTAAAAIAKLAGAPVVAEPFRPVIRGRLLTGGAPIYMSAHPLGSESFESAVYDEPPWPPEEKVVAEELGPYLTALDASRRAADSTV